MKSYGLLLVLTFLNVLNFIDRQLIPSLAQTLMEDLGLTRAQIGLLYGYVFIVFYTAVGLGMGRAADRWNRPRLIAGGLALWSGLTAASGAAGSLLHLTIARLLVGVGEATLTPAALSMLSDTFPPRRRAFASGFYYAGVPLGAGLSLVLSGWIATRYGWRVCFYALGLLGLVVAPLTLLLRDPARTSQAPRAPPTQFFYVLRRTPALWLAILGGTIFNYSAASSSHVLTWLTQERGFSFQDAAYLSGGIYTAAGLIGTIGGGWISDWRHRRWTGGRLWFLVAKGALFFPIVILFYSLPTSSPLFYAAWIFSSLSSTAWYGPVFATVQDLVPGHIRSSALAFLLLALNLLGSGPGPWITGRIGDAFSLWRALILSTVVGFLAVIPFALAARRYGRDLAALHPVKELAIQ